jgi:hypothetical protein
MLEYRPLYDKSISLSNDAVQAIADIKSLAQIGSTVPDEYEEATGE